MRFLSLLLLLSPVALRAQPSAATEAAFFDALTKAYLDDHAGAVARYRDLLADAPDQPAILDALAVSYAALGDLSLAQDAADAATRLAPDNPFYAATAARIAVQRGDLSGADTRYRALLGRHPDHPGGLAGLAGLLERQGALAEAVALLERLPATPDVLDRRLALYERLGDDAALAAALPQRMAFGPVESALLRRWRAAPARPDGTRTAEAPPDAPTGDYAAYASGDFDGAIRQFRAALDRDAGDVDRWAALAMALLETGDLDAARVVLEDGALIFFDAPSLRVPALYAALLEGDAAGAEALLAMHADAPEPVRAALVLAEAAVRKAQADDAEARRLRDAAFERLPLEALQAHALAPAGGALQKLLP